MSAISVMNLDGLLTFPGLFQWRIEGTQFLMDGSWDCLSIYLSFLLTKYDMELRFVGAVEADNFASTWCIEQIAKLASWQCFRFLEFLL